MPNGDEPIAHKRQESRQKARKQSDDAKIEVSSAKVASKPSHRGVSFADDDNDDFDKGNNRINDNAAIQSAP